MSSKRKPTIFRRFYGIGGQVIIGSTIPLGVWYPIRSVGVRKPTLGKVRFDTVDGKIVQGKLDYWFGYLIISTTRIINNRGLD